jgi:oligopeptide transport system substrate-binding protein
MRKNLTVLSLLVAFSVILAACGPAETPAPAPVEPGAPVEPAAPVEPEPVERKVLNLNFGPGDVPTLDPAIAEDTSSIQVIDEAFIGLTYLDPVTSETMPGMATSWDAVDNADGTQTITFHMRDDIPWVRWNGTEVETVKTCDGSADRMVNANDFAYGIERNLNPANGSPYAYVWGFVLKGADDYNTGASTDFTTVGVTVVDDYTIALDYIAPASYNVQIAGMWIGRPQPKWVIEGDCDGAVEAKGERWTEPGFFQSYGPYTMSEWTHDSEMVLVKNPFWPGTDAVQAPKIDEIRFSMLDDAVAFAEYEAGNLDATAVPGTDLDRVKADPVLSQELVTAPVTCTYYYGFNTTAPIVDDVRVRRALSMALDRQGLIDNVLKGGQEPAQWFGRPGIAAAPTMDTHPDLGIKYDPEGAVAELQAYLDETGQTADQLDITIMFNTSSGHQQIAEAVQQMWNTTLGINAQLVNQEWAVYLDTIDSLDTPQVWRLGWCQDYPDENNFIREVFAYGGQSNSTDAAGNPSGGIMWKNDTFEELVAQAAIETDPAVRLDLYAQAEEILVDTDAVMIPIYWYSRNTVTKPYVERTFGAAGQEGLHDWDILAH